MNMSTPIRVALMTVAVGATVTATACGNDSDAAQEPVTNWRSVDPCSLVDEDQLSKISDHGGSLKREHQDDRTSKICNFTGDGESRPLRIQFQGLPPSMADVPAPGTGRTTQIKGRNATVILETGGFCNVRFKFDGVTLGVVVDPSRDKTGIDPSDDSSKSCDAQTALIGDIVDKANLK